MAGNMWIWIWLGVTAVSLVFEFITMDLVTVWFVAGGIVSMILAALNVPADIQIVVFIALSLVLLLSLRKLSLKYLFRNGNEKTNIDLNIGKVLLLREEITPIQNGTIRINGVDWTAIANEDESINKGEMVEIVELLGNKFLVKIHKKDKKEENENALEEPKVVTTEIRKSNVTTKKPSITTKDIVKKEVKETAKKAEEVKAVSTQTTKKADEKEAVTKKVVSNNGATKKLPSKNTTKSANTTTKKSTAKK